MLRERCILVLLVLLLVCVWVANVQLQLRQAAGVQKVEHEEAVAVHKELDQYVVSASSSFSSS